MKRLAGERRSPRADGMRGVTAASALIFTISVVAMTGAGCLDHGVFKCTKDQQCQPGLCETSSGGCSYADTGCGSGRRYSAHAPDPYAGVCVADACPTDPVITVRGGGAHVCEVKEKGTVACWGDGTDGQLGDGTMLSRSTPVAINASALAPARDVALGGRHTCALLKEHSVWCWGANEAGQLGDGTTVSRANPVPVVDAMGSPLDGVVAIAAGGAFTCAARDTGDVLCWGVNSDGQLGQGAAGEEPSPTPRLVMGLTNVQGLSARDRHVCALTMDGVVSCWGSNEQGELGDGSRISQARPTAALLPSDHKIEGLAAGAAHTCAVGDGLLWCWGANQLGELGDGSEQDELVPSEVPLPHVTDVAAAGHHTCAREADGSVWCWGANQAGQLGEGTTSNFAVPVPVTDISDAVEITAGDAFSCVRRHEGTVWCWGDDRMGQLGIDAPIERLTPTPVGNPVVGDVLSISAGGAHTCALRPANPAGLPNGATASVPLRAICWGDNQAGQIGDGTRLDHSVPVSLKINLDAEQIVAGALHTCLRATGGGVWCWGRGGSGQLGTPALIDLIVPTGVVGLGEATWIAAGQSHTCALLKDTSVRCWGSNSDGQLGDGSANSRSKPTAVPGEVGVLELALGGSHTCARHADGTVHCWGRGSEGQLGDGNRMTSLFPVGVAGLKNAVGIAAGGAHSCAVLADMTVSCWGAGSHGQLGWGALENHGVPSNVMNLSGALEIAAGENHTCARTSPDGQPENAGNVFCWGDNSQGQLGDGSHVPSGAFGPRLDRPILAGDAVAIAAGGAHSCAIKRDRTMVCWGSNNTGQLGDATVLQHPTAQHTRTLCPKD